MSDIRTSLTAIRAVSALLLQRFLHPALLMITIILVAIYVLTTLLALSFSTWWWLLLFILIPVTLFLLVVGYILWFLLQQLLPRHLTRVERQKLKTFIDKLFSLAERTRTPYPILLFLIAKDTIRGRGSSFVGNLIGDSKDVVREFNDIQKMFS